MMLLKNCRLIPELSSGRKSEQAAILVENGKIAAIHENGLPDYHGDVYDCQGKTLLPGLFDLHTHISGLRYTSSYDLKDPMALLIKCAEKTQRYLDYGFTTIRDAGSIGRVANYVRDMIDAGVAVGPRVIACGRIISPTESEEGSSFFEMGVDADGKDEVLKAVRKEIAEHADFIKIYASGSALHRQGIPAQAIMTAEEIRTATETAASKKTYVAAHAHSSDAIKLCIKEGVHTIEHATYVDDEAIQMLLDQDVTYLVPTLAAMYQDEATTKGTAHEYLLKKLREMLDISAVNLGKAYRAGLKLGFGTDSTVGMHQYDRGIEFMYRKEHCNMSNLDILLQATRYSAEIAGLANITGEIKEGLAADLILVDGRPDEDISVMYHKPEMVMMGGVKVR